MVLKNTDFDDKLYDMYFLSKVYEGLKDAKEGRLITTEELLKRLDTWER